MHCAVAGLHLCAAAGDEALPCQLQQLGVDAGQACRQVAREPAAAQLPAAQRQPFRFREVAVASPGPVNGM